MSIGRRHQVQKQNLMPFLIISKTPILNVILIFFYDIYNSPRIVYNLSEGCPPPDSIPERYFKWKIVLNSFFPAVW